MLRFRPSTDAKAGYHYFSRSDSGLEPDELRTEVGGKAAELLGLSAEPDFEQFARLLQGLDPHTGEQLTAKLIDGRISYWDVTASVPKGVTIAIEHGDSRVHDALWEAGREAMKDLEAHVTTRMRKGGAQDDRLTRNLIWYGFEHPETRPNRDDGMPDPDRHIHFVIPNVIFDPVEKEYKAIKFRSIMDLRKWFDRRFDMRLASKLTALGYSIETKYKPDERGGNRYFSWDIRGMPGSAVKKYSRRGAEVDALANELGIGSAAGKDKLGATSRLHKRDDKTLEDYRKYWLSRLTPQEQQQIGEVIADANRGRNPEPTNTAERGVAWAIAHEFERRSVIDEHALESTAMERCMGGATPEEIQSQMKRQGVLLKNGQATTSEVLAEETKILDWAREGRGTMRPLNHSPDATKMVGLSAEQATLVEQVLRSPDRLVLLVGDAGTGKTHSVKAAFAQIDRPIEMLAPSADASRGTLRREGFSRADTVASFLNDDQRQQAVQNGVLWVDEAGLLAIRDLSALVEVARRVNAKLVLQGDNKQHSSPARSGNMFHVLQEYAGIVPGRLKEIRRQQHEGYKQAVSHIAAGRLTAGFDQLRSSNWVKETEGNAQIADDYMEVLSTKRRDQDDRDRVAVIAPTHTQGEEITHEIRQRLRAAKALAEDQEFDRLVPLHWTQAERGDLERYDGSEVLAFHKNSGTFAAGDLIAVKDWKKGMRYKSAEHFSVYRPAKIALAPGDLVRFTRNGRTKDGHRIDNGAVYRVKRIARHGEHGEIELDNGWKLPADYRFLDHGYVSTSFAAQGRTADIVLIAMGKPSLPAIDAEQFYVSVSRGRHAARIYTDLPAEELREAIQKADSRRSATELLRSSKRARPRRKAFLVRVKEGYDRLRESVVGILARKERNRREHAYER